MQPIRIYILEDEVVTQAVLRECLEEYGYTVCGMATSAQRALEQIKTLQPDLAILDINVKGEETGIWLGNQLSIPFIYLTAYNDQNTIKSALQTHPHSYLIKPFENIQVFTAVELALANASTLSKEQTLEDPKAETETAEEFKKENGPYLKLNGQLVIKEGYKYFKIDPKDIQYLMADGKYLELHLPDKRYVFRSSLIRFLENFSELNFLRVHKAYAINKARITSYDANNIWFGETVVPLSRSYKGDFFKLVEKEL